MIAPGTKDGSVRETYGSMPPPVMFLGDNPLHIDESVNLVLMFDDLDVGYCLELHAAGFCGDAINDPEEMCAHATALHFGADVESRHLLSSKAAVLVIHTDAQREQTRLTLTPESNV